MPLTAPPEEMMRRAIRRGRPLGDPEWQERTVARLGLGSTVQPLGRPKKKNCEIGS